MSSTISNILVIDDDTRLRTLLGRFLGENGFQVSLAKDTAEAKEIIATTKFDLMIVDVMLPNETGVEFTSKLRQSSRIPVIMLTARGEFEDRIKGLEAGADDYLQKPFEPKELLLRINNILKRIGTTADDLNICRFGDFSFSFVDSRLKKGNEFIHITDSETKILGILCKEKGKTISREKLSALCGDIDERSIDVQITRLRRKIEQNPKQPNYLQTVRNHGYVLYS
ncbi:MAG: response regulator [Proteobacteria bacterium]|nr:response regulator [Pseudomonadota bacterium]